MENYLYETIPNSGMKRGRPVRSQVRQNMVDLISVTGPAYGYEICRKYRRVFPKVTLRSIYYHLRKGEALGEFKVHKVQVEKGKYSWGSEVEKKYYSLGDNANPSGHERVAKLIESAGLPLAQKGHEAQSSAVQSEARPRFPTRKEPRQ